MANVWRKKIDGIEVASGQMLEAQEVELDAWQFANRFAADPNPSEGEVRYAVRWLMARELGLPTPPIPAGLIGGP